MIHIDFLSLHWDDELKFIEILGIETTYHFGALIYLGVDRSGFKMDLFFIRAIINWLIW